MKIISIATAFISVVLAAAKDSSSSTTTTTTTSTDGSYSRRHLMMGKSKCAKGKRSCSPSTVPSETPSLSSFPSSEPSNEPSISSGPSEQPSERPSLSLMPSDYCPIGVRVITCGATGSGDCTQTPQSIVVDENEIRAVRCCSDSATTTLSTGNNFTWGGTTSCINGGTWCESQMVDVLQLAPTTDNDFIGCTVADFAGAEAICAVYGGRLCTREELENNCCDDTGCQFDFGYVWTSDCGDALPPLTVNLDVGIDGAPGSPPVYVGTGAAPDSGTFWNSFANFGVISTLLASDSDGTTHQTCASVDLSAFNDGFVWTVSSLVMNDGFFIGSPVGNADIVISGLVPNAKYDLYIYSSVWNCDYTVSGTTESTTGNTDGSPSNMDSTAYIEGNNYVVFQDETADGSGDMTITAANVDAVNGWVNIAGLQIMGPINQSC